MLQLQMNYYFLKSCVENSPIPPIQEKWLQNIKDKISADLKKDRDKEMDVILVEIKDNFYNSMKRTLVQMSLKKPNVPGLENDDLVPFPEEIT